MLTKVFEVQIDQQKYDVFVNYKRQRNMYLRFKEGAFYVSAPFLMSSKKILEFVIKSGPKLIKRTTKEIQKNYSIEEGFIYLFGERCLLEISDKFWINENIVFYKNIDDLQKNLHKLLGNYLEQSVRKYEDEMGIKKPYKISVKKMKTRYGSNSKQTHRLHFQIDLVHFSKDIIDSVVVHELAHEFYRNHQSGFYSCVLEYCPNYKELKKKLRQKVYS